MSLESISKSLVAWSQSQGFPKPSQLRSVERSAINERTQTGIASTGHDSIVKKILVNTERGGAPRSVEETPFDQTCGRDENQNGHFAKGGYIHFVS